MEWDDAPRADSDEATRLPLLLRQALHAVDGLVVSALAAEGFSELGVVAANALVLVAGGWRGKPITTVATDLRISPQAAGRLVAGLEAADLVYRVPHPRDARAFLFSVTSDGAAATTAMARGVTDALHLLAEDVGEERLAALVRDLAVIAEVGQPRSPWDL